jgi:hypothetical protein
MLTSTEPHLDVPQNVRTFIELICTQVKIVIEDNEPVTPALLFHLVNPVKTRDIGIMPIAELVNSQAGKELIRTIMEETIQQNNIDIVVFVSEAWAAKLSEEEKAQHVLKHKRVSERKDKVEILMFSIMTKDRQFLGSAEILREPSSTLAPLELFSVDSPGSEGNLVRRQEPPVVH